MDKGQARGLSPLVWATAGIGVLLLVADHWAHVLGVLPYLVLLACPLMHFFMHRGQGHAGHRGSDADQPPRTG